ncbi:MAG: hypothetical protein KBS59_03395, partial [Clostridiales bacterium]|nr:hypothetical protein [Clostridiales bacterium]
MNFKDLFVKHDTSRSERDDYKVSSGKKSLIIIAVVSLLCAFLIWAAAVYVDSSVHTFSNVKIEIRNAEALTDAGYSITMSDNTVTFTVRVNSNVADVLTQDSVVPYIDFSGVT